MGERGRTGLTGLREGKILYAIELERQKKRLNGKRKGEVRKE